MDREADEARYGPLDEPGCYQSPPHLRNDVAEIIAMAMADGECCGHRNADGRCCLSDNQVLAALAERGVSTEALQAMIDAKGGGGE